MTAVKVGDRIRRTVDCGTAGCRLAAHRVGVEAEVEHLGSGGVAGVRADGDWFYDHEYEVISEPPKPSAMDWLYVSSEATITVGTDGDPLVISSHPQYGRPIGALAPDAHGLVHVLWEDGRVRPQRVPPAEPQTVLVAVPRDIALHIIRGVLPGRPVGEAWSLNAEQLGWLATVCKDALAREAGGS